MQQSPGALILQLPFLIFFLLVFYFILIRPQQKKQKDHRLMIEGIKKNDEIVTAGGIHGTVVNIKEKTLILRVDDNTKVEVDKYSISYIKKKRENT